MSDEEDYLSDKFLIDVSGTTQPKTYTQRRQETLKQSHTKNLQNRTKSRRQREQESREDGLNKSLFERATVENDAGANKALGIMQKMGFQLGQSLGKLDDSPPTALTALPDTSESVAEEESQISLQSTDAPITKHKVEPLPLNEWAGKKGIGLGKRARSPNVSERIAKMAKMAEKAEQESFRDRSRREYEERHAESRLILAQRTCFNLDEKAGIVVGTLVDTFNVLWLNPNHVETIPPELSDALAESISTIPATGGSETARLRNQMRTDALVPLTAGYDDDEADPVPGNLSSNEQQGDLAPEAVEEAVHFLRLGPRDRLNLVLTYLRDKYAYCFWCGTQYDSTEDIQRHCPGSEEEDHD
ncbi:hypothetical protein ID866_1218 [Astraeus odoratus]|nr:hypothetical protein ID866_1218 [Astraeus odoratus]